jgi:hypothetical protein
MTTLPIIKHLDPFEDVLACFISREIATMMHEFDFQRVKEAFDHCIVLAVALAAHRAVDTVRGQQPLIISGRVLDSTVRVMQQSAMRLASA